MPRPATARATRLLWLRYTGADGACNRLRSVTGLDYFRYGEPGKLHTNLGRVILYATKPLPSGALRDLAADALVSGLLDDPWRECVRAGTADALRPSGGACEHCGAALPPGRRGQTRRYCPSPGRTNGTSKCKSAAHRSRQRDGLASTAKPSRGVVRALAPARPVPPAGKVGKP